MTQSTGYGVAELLAHSSVIQWRYGFADCDESGGRGRADATATTEPTPTAESAPATTTEPTTTATVESAAAITIEPMPEITLDPTATATLEPMPGDILELQIAGFVLDAMQRACLKFTGTGGNVGNAIVPGANTSLTNSGTIHNLILMLRTATNIGTIATASIGETASKTAALMDNTDM